MARKFIDSVIREMREASQLERVNTFEETKRDVAEIASKQVLRKMRVDGYASPYASKRNARATANRVLPESKDRKCPPGYRFDAKQLMCVPIKPNDSVGRGQNMGGSRDLRPGNGPGYNTWGASGYAGGYAFEERPTSNDLGNGGGGYDGGNGGGNGGGMGEAYQPGMKDMAKSLEGSSKKHKKQAEILRKNGLSEMGPEYPYETAEQAKAQRDRRFGRRNKQGDKTRQEPGNTPAAHTSGYNRTEALDPVGREDNDINNDGRVDGSDKYLKNRRKKIRRAMTEHEYQAEQMVSLIDELAYEATIEDPWAMHAYENAYDRRHLEETQEEAPDYEHLQLKCETALEMLSRKLIDMRATTFVKEDYDEVLNKKYKAEQLIKRIKRERAKNDPILKDRQLQIARKGVK